MDEKESEAKNKGKRCKYASKIKDRTKTVLHLAAEKNLYGIAQHVLQLYPKQCYLSSEDGELPLQLAIGNNCDETGALLAKSMLKER